MAWASDPAWPAKPDFWLDWLPSYDHPLGAPLADGAKEGGVWTRAFASGTHVAFDAVRGNGTIWWSNGVVQRGSSAPPRNATHAGCKWQTM